MASIPYDRRKEYFKRYYKENKTAFLERNRLNRQKQQEKVAVLEAVVKLVDPKEKEEMERKFQERMRASVKS